LFKNESFLTQPPDTLKILALALWSSLKDVDSKQQLIRYDNHFRMFGAGHRHYDHRASPFLRPTTYKTRRLMRNVTWNGQAHCA
jgi:hypothetical protein